MNIATLPLWAEWLISVLLVSGAALAFLGTVGLVRLRDFFDRVHAPTLCTSMGMAGVVLASICYFTVSGQRPSVHEVLILVFVTMTTPVTLTLLARAAYLRRLESRGNDFPQDTTPRER